MNYLPDNIADKLRHARHLLELQSPPAPADVQRTPSGEVIPTLTTYAQVYGCVEPLVGRELERAKSFGASVSHKVTIRYVCGVLTDHVIRFGDHKLLINSALRPNEVAPYLEIMATEVLS